VLPARGLRAGRAGTAARLTLLALSGVAYMAVRVLLTTPAGAPLSLRTASLRTSQLVRRAENPLTFVRGRVPRLLSTAWIQVVYAGLLLAPRHFCVEYSYDCIPMVTRLSDPRNALSLLLLLLLFCFAAHLLRAARAPHARATMAVSAWMLFPWFLASHIPLRLGTLIAERTMYLPSVGVILLVAHILRPLPSRARARGARHAWWWRRSGALPVGVAVGYLAALSLRRTLDWTSDETAFVSAVEVCPRSAKLNNQLCTLRSNQHRHAEALAHCEAAHAIDPQFCDVHSNFAFIYIARDDFARAVHHLNASLPCPWTNVKAYKTLLTLYDLYLRRDPQNATTYGQLASSHAVIGNLREAVLFHREAAALHLRADRPARALAALAEAERAQLQVGPLVPPSLPLADSEYEDDAAAAGEEVVPPPVPALSSSPRDCTLGYWRGRALLALQRPDEARVAFAAVGGCEAEGGVSTPAIAAAASAERAAAERAATERALLSSDAATAGAANAAAASASAAATVTAGARQPRVLGLSFHAGVSASLRWAAVRQGWHLELPEVDGFMWRGCDAATGGEGGDDAVATAAADGFVQASARYVFSHARAACVWRDGSLQASPAQAHDMSCIICPCPCPCSMSMSMSMSISMFHVYSHGTCSQHVVYAHAYVDM